MDSRDVTVLLTCLDRAVERGLPYNKTRIEFAITALAEGRPALDGVNKDLRTFLTEIRLDPGDFFTDAERSHAETFLRNLESGVFHSSRSSFALSLPPGTNPEVDLLIYEPQRAMESLYLKGLAQNIGTPAERKAIEKILWLRPLEVKDYKLANAFMEKLFKAGIRGEGGQTSQARFLLDLLAPGSDPHKLVARLVETGLPKQMRRLTGPQSLPTTTTPTQATEALDDLLVILSNRLREVAKKGDTREVEKLLTAVRNITEAVQTMGKTPAPPSRPNTPAVFSALKSGSARLTEADWVEFDRISASPVMNVALMPLGVVEHVLASMIMGELSWEESIDEAVDVLGGSAVVGGTLIGSVTLWNTMMKAVEDKRLGVLINKVRDVAPARLRAYLVPVLILSAFTFIALRQTQSLPIEEVGEYRWKYLEEMLAGFGIQLVVTGSSFMGIRSFLTRIGKVPKGKIGGAGVLGLATGMGMIAQEVYTSYRRQGMRGDLKTKTYAELIGLLREFKKFPPHLKPKLQTRIDRKLSILIALNVLEFPSVQEAAKEAEKKEKKFDQLLKTGLSEDRAIRLLEGYEKMEPLNSTEQKIAERWIQKVGKKPSTPALSVSMLPAQKKRIVTLWEKELADIIQFLLVPKPLPILIDPKREIDTNQFKDWGIAQTLSLLSHYVRLQST